MSAHPAGPRHGEPQPVHSIARPATTEAALVLDPAVWPRSASRNTDGAVQIGQLDVRDVVAEAGSPVVLLDEEHVRTAARSYCDAYAQAAGGADVYYAGKAFLSTAFVGWLIEEGLRIDVCTRGELEVALAGGADPAHILFHGNNKSLEEIGRALDVGVGRIVIDSLPEIARVAALAEERDVVADVFVRVTVGVEAHTHEFIATAHEDQKFGLALADGSALTAIERVAALHSLRLVGLHSHIGSQIFDPSGFEVAARRLVRLIGDLASPKEGRNPIAIPELNLGGGMGIAYLPGDEPLDVGEMAEAICGIVARECDLAGVARPRIAVEPGRAIVGPAGITLYTVGTTKTVSLDSGAARTYISVDGGMSDNIRTALYDADYTVTLANRDSTAPLVLSRVVGKHCESGDIIVKEAWLPQDVCPGDLLAVAATGAYCRSMASNYNMLPRPGVMSVRDGELRTLIRRETLDDLLALDAGR